MRGVNIAINDLIHNGCSTLPHCYVSSFVISLFTCHIIMCSPVVLSLHFIVLSPTLPQYLCPLSSFHCSLTAFYLSSRDFDSHAAVAIWCDVHRPMVMERIRGFMRSHYMPPSGECPCHTPPAAHGDEFVEVEATQNTNKHNF
jgi:hypothetical protein